MTSLNHFHSKATIFDYNGWIILPAYTLKRQTFVDTEGFAVTSRLLKVSVSSGFRM
jgi:hypothetical protein